MSTSSATPWRVMSRIGALPPATSCAGQPLRRLGALELFDAIGIRRFPGGHMACAVPLERDRGARERRGGGSRGAEEGYPLGQPIRLPGRVLRRPVLSEKAQAHNLGRPEA